MRIGSISNVGVRKNEAKSNIVYDYPSESKKKMEKEKGEWSNHPVYVTIRDAYR